MVIDKIVFGKMIIDGLKHQIRHNDPPETKQTYSRLMKKYGDYNKVFKCMGAVLVAEVFNVLKTQRSFNKKRYIKRLKKLPDLSWLKKGK